MPATEKACSQVVEVGRIESRAVRSLSSRDESSPRDSSSLKSLSSLSSFGLAFEEKNLEIPLFMSAGEVSSSEASSRRYFKIFCDQ